jgi:Na+-driven multidrug efflux pump
MAVRTYKILSKGYSYGRDTPERRRNKKLEGFYHALAFSCFASKILYEMKYIENLSFFKDSESLIVLHIATPILISNLIVYSVPIFYRIIASLTSNPNWFKEKILIPILSSLAIGIITWILTGHFQFGTSVTLISIPIAWILKLTINIEAES